MRVWTFHLKAGRKAEALRLMEASIAQTVLPGLLGSSLLLAWLRRPR